MPLIIPMTTSSPPPPPKSVFCKAILVRLYCYIVILSYQVNTFIRCGDIYYGTGRESKHNVTARRVLEQSLNSPADHGVSCSMTYT